MTTAGGAVFSVGGAVGAIVVVVVAVVVVVLVVVMVVVVVVVVSLVVVAVVVDVVVSVVSVEFSSSSISETLESDELDDDSLFLPLLFRETQITAIAIITSAITPTAMQMNFLLFISSVSFSFTKSHP